MNACKASICLIFCLYLAKCLFLLCSGAPGSSQQQVIYASSPQVAERPASMPGPSSAPPTAPPVQTVHQPSALFSSNPFRSQLSQVHLPSGNHQIRSELRAPAPHLQPFRPVTSMSTPSFSSPTVHPGQQPLGNPATTSPIHSQPTHMSGSFSRVQQSDNPGGVRTTQNHSLSALKILTDMERHPSPRPQTPLLPTLQAIAQFKETWNTPEHRTTNIRGSGTGTAGDVVCLSDDD